MHLYTVALLSAVPIPATWARRTKREPDWPTDFAEPDQPATGVLAPHPLLEGAGDLPADRAAAARAGAGPAGRVPLPGEQAADSAVPVTVQDRPVDAEQPRAAKSLPLPQIVWPSASICTNLSIRRARVRASWRRRSEQDGEPVP